MNSHRFSIGKEFFWNDEFLKIIDVRDDDTIILLNINNKLTHYYKKGELIDAFFKDEISFFNKEENFSLDKEISINKTFEDFTKFEQEVANYRYDVILPLIQMEKISDEAINNRSSELKIKNINKPFGLLTACSPSSIKSWIKAYKESEFDLKSLIPKTGNRGGKNRNRIDPLIEEIIDAELEKYWRKNEKVTIKDIYHIIAAKLDKIKHENNLYQDLSYPSIDTIRRRAKEKDIYERFVLKRGKQAANKAFKQVKKSFIPESPLVRTQIDSTILDLLVVDDNDGLPIGRPTMTLLIDEATRYVLGWYIGFEPPSYYSVMECLYHAISKKPNYQNLYGTKNNHLAYGIPQFITMDNGKEFLGKHLKEACRDLGINQIFAPFKTPDFKGIVERYFKTQNNLLHSLPGTTFSNIFDKAEYDSLKHACISLTDFNLIFHKYILDIYHESKNNGLGGIPARKWEDKTKNGYEPRLPSSNKELKILLGRTEYRRLWHYGIDYERIRYNSFSNEIGQLRVILNHQKENKKVKIRIDPSDLSKIYLYNPIKEKYSEMYSNDEAYTKGLSLWKHRIIKAYAYRNEDKENPIELGEAKIAIQDLVNKAFDFQKSRKNIAMKNRKSYVRYQGDLDLPSTRDVITKKPKINISSYSEKNNKAGFSLIKNSELQKTINNNKTYETINNNWDLYKK